MQFAFSFLFFCQGYCLYLPTGFITIWFVRPSLALSPTVMWPPQCNIVNFVDQITYPSDINMYSFHCCLGRKEIINLHFCYWFQKKNPGSMSDPAKLSKLRVFWWGREEQKQWVWWKAVEMHLKRIHVHENIVLGIMGNAKKGSG